MDNQFVERKRDWLMQGLLCGLGVFTVLFLFPSDMLYGSMVDWLNQHQVFPEYFRQQFYQTGNLFPDFSWEIGGGQNLYQFSYYGLFSPWLLVFYGLPFLSAEIYLPIAMVGSILFSVCIGYRWLRFRGYSLWTAFLASSCFLWAAPLLFHTHRHLMFISYMPFLMLAIFGIEKLVHTVDSFRSRKLTSVQITLAVVCLILSSYFFAPSCLVVLLIYTTFCVLETSQGLQNFSSKLLWMYGKIGLLFMLAIGITAFLLIPTAWTLLFGRTSEGAEQATSFLSLFLPNWQPEWLTGSAYGMGLTPVVFLAAIYALFQKNKAFRFLAAICLLFLLVPFFVWMLNGTLYIHEKILIPFVPLWILLLAQFLSAFVNWGNNHLHMKRKQWLYGALGLVVLLSALFIQIYVQQKEEWVTQSFIKELDIPEKTALLKTLRQMDSTFYRTDDLIENTFTVNQTYGGAYRSSVYASISNQRYNTFYYDWIENPISARNRTITSASPQIFSQTFLGVKYLFATDEKMIPIGYQRLGSELDTDAVQVYQNTNVSSIGYALPSTITETKFQNLPVTERLSALFQQIVVTEKENGNIGNSTKKVSTDWFSEFYATDTKQFAQALTDAVKQAETKEVQTILPLPNVKNEEIILLTFDVSNKETQASSDILITMNGIKNKLSKKTAPYPNENRQFIYMFSGVTPDWSNLEVTLSKGTYQIHNIQLYRMNYARLQEAVKQRDVFLAKRPDPKTGVLSGQITVQEDGYFATTIPYAKGFQIKVDGVLQTYECVNTAFVGFPIQAGMHQIEISYQAPGKQPGIIVSMVSVLFFLIWIFFGKEIYTRVEPILERYKKMIQEILLYLFFGVLTTAVSFLTFQFSLSILGATWMIANLISWILSVLFAYFTNRTWVFQSKQSRWLTECMRFAASRLFSLVLEMFSLWIFIEVLHMTPLIAKIWAAVIVVISNYIFSRIFVFRNGLSSE
ncbi:MAG TPA: YfhO family protein [Firmicutes bacterium]|nr:YfhO family protein [Bacillota bacterium]